MVVVTGREPDSRRPDGAMSSSDAEDDFLEPATPTATQAGHALPLLPQEFPEVVPLNIGGAHFTTRLSTLRRYEDTMLAAMFSGRHYIPTDAEGRYFIDRDGTHFGDVLNFLRSGDLPPRERVRAVYKEAQYYAIGPLLEQLENMQPLKGEKVRQAFLGLMPYYKVMGAVFTPQTIWSGLWRLPGCVRYSGRPALPSSRSVSSRRRCPSPPTSVLFSTPCASSGARAMGSSLSTIAKWMCLLGPGRLWLMFMTYCTAWSRTSQPRASSWTTSALGCVTSTSSTTTTASAPSMSSRSHGGLQKRRCWQCRSLLISHYSALFLGMAYGAKCYSYLKPQAEELKRIAAKEKKKQEKWKHTERELAEAPDNSILK
ncbi:BTB/POZ domain-containing protein KCTD7 isoform X2 [Zalophus californianus]|uniref:BTB/POZ domain-containing protein KCTD7 n=1 Tax=Zalophus californianus TaxID=9704 RepID=A0A6J2EGZ6_ZALCA|nr:BTB/POZ domain-containing protein KCTD7 isoform X2 [Zalophus californianus]